MGNIKTFLNIGFLVLCMVMLWYLFSYNTKGKNVREDFNSRNRQTYVEEEFRNNNNYGNNGYGNSRSQDPMNDPYEELEEIPKESNSGGGFFSRNRNKEYDERKAREREAERDRIRQEEVQTYTPPQNYDNYNNSDNPYDRQDTYTPPSEQRTQTTTRPASGSSTTVRYGTKRFSRDNQLGTYKGPLLNGQPHGYGFIEYDNKDIYVGEYRYGQRHGFGNSIYRRGKSGQVKLRQYSKGRQLESSPVNSVSYGNMRFVNGGSKGTYYGPLKSQEPHGFGYFKYDNGNVYVGAYKNGKRHGSGNMIYADRSISPMRYDYGRQIN